MSSEVETIDAFWYDLPKERIAQRPVHPADHAKMLVIDRKAGTLFDSRFSEIPSYLSSKDRLVFNETKVVPARLFGKLDSAAGAQVELLLIEKITESQWVCIGRPLRKVRSVGRVKFSDSLWAEVVSDDGNPERVTVEFKTSENTHISMAIAAHGTMPIPPYIRKGVGDEQDAVDYQSIFARHPGSVAAPTASLHFNDDLMTRITDGVGTAVSRITLHVGPASFLPVIDEGKLKKPGSERFEVSDGAKREMVETRAKGGRVIAVGTTVVRALESCTKTNGATELFISPGYSFELVDAVVTNFHQPGTTHLLLVEALLGKELLSRAYEHAMKNDYRFLSYGDGMLIV